MDYAIVRETFPGEERVALTPEGVRSLVDAGHEVAVQTGAGERAGFSDTAYVAAGAQLVFSDYEAAARTDVLVRVRPPQSDELDLVTPESVLVGFLHLAGGSDLLIQRLMGSGSTAIALELIEKDGRRAVMDPMSAIGGRIALSLVQHHLTRMGGGMGVLLGGSPGVPPARVAVIGAGAAGLAAAETARGLGAEVAILDIDPTRLMLTVDRLPGVTTVGATTYNLTRYVEWADIVIGAVARRGEPAPKIVTRNHLRVMKSHAIFVDLSIDEGGCAETSRPTTPEDPVYVEEGIRHLCIPNLPALVARTSSETLSIAATPWLLALGEGVHEALREHPELRRPTQILDGVVTSRRVARFHGARRRELSELL